MAPTNPTEKKNPKENLNPKQMNAMATFGVANFFFFILWLAMLVINSSNQTN
jgi:hypothetical protein